MRVFVGSLCLLAVFLVSFAMAQDRQPPPPISKGKTTEPGKPLQFDVDRFFHDFDKNGDGYLQRDELPPEYRGIFGRLDVNKDGKISRDELTGGIAYMQPRRRPSDYVYMLIEMSDLDDDSPIEVQRAYDILKSLDKNRDGQIDADELKAGRERIVENRVGYLFGQLDKDKDGRISREEARGMIRQNFAEIDKNRDGFLEREELKQAILEKPVLDAPAPGAAPRTPPPARPTDR